MQPTLIIIPRKRYEHEIRLFALTRQTLIEQLRRQHRQHTTTRSPAECPYCGTAWAVAMWGERMRG